MRVVERVTESLKTSLGSNFWCRDFPGGPVAETLFFHHRGTGSILGEGAKIPHGVLFCCCSVAQSCPTLCKPLDRSTPGSPVLHYLLELAQTHVH